MYDLVPNAYLVPMALKRDHQVLELQIVERCHMNPGG